MSHITRVEWIQCVSTSSHHLLLLRQGSSKLYDCTLPFHPADSDGTCQFYSHPLAMQLHTNCIIDLNGKNKGFETSKVPGFVTLLPGDMNVSLCNETKEVIVYNG